MKKRSLIVTICLAIVAISACFWFYTSHKEETASSKTTTKTKKASSTTVLVVSDQHSFASTSTVKFLTTDVDSLQHIDSKVRFILIPKEKTVSEKLLQQLLAQKKVVFFYGEDVSPETVQKKIGLEFDYEGTDVQSSIPFYYVMFGYGYSKSAQGETIWFLQNNSTELMEKNIAEFFAHHSEEY
jgi:uncharacterized protein YpmB